MTATRLPIARGTSSAASGSRPARASRSNSPSMCISVTSVLIVAPERKATNNAANSGMSSSTRTRTVSSSAYCGRP
jgi:hypothetical protein